MKQATRDALNRAYVKLLRLVDELYDEVDKAIENEDFDDASLLEARAEILFEQAEAISAVISAVIMEQTNG
ncbi:MAG: hypothetical protein KME64_38780 [Scytonematopsis contorta HA4267-MV1]|jgi:uncharacterized protein YgfB (UPF0149 family)|nr:hypothetical protein [Scytonematopsis contorta HA4267-MV1]